MIVYMLFVGATASSDSGSSGSTVTVVVAVVVVIVVVAAIVVAIVFIRRHFVCELRLLLRRRCVIYIYYVCPELEFLTPSS